MVAGLPQFSWEESAMIVVTLYRAVRTAALATVFASIPGLGFNADAQEAGDANAILKAMSDYLASQKSISATFNSDIEVITPDLQKIQFASTGRLQLSRPDKIHVSRTGGYTDVELFFDGKTFVLEDKKHSQFVQADAPGTVDQLVTKLRTELSADMPGADLLVSNPYQVLSDDILDAKHIGRGVVSGVECEHLAFRGSDTDWQLWVDAGSKPIPRKMVITSKSVTGAPQYTLLITEWNSDAPIAADAFAFNAPAGTKKIDAKDLVDVDEVPPGAYNGGNK
jgi:hypothetical protein